MRREGEVSTFSNIYLCIQYQVHKCKYPESIIKSIRNYRESNTNCNKVNMLVLFSYHTCKSARQSHTTKVLHVCFGFICLFNYVNLYKTDYPKYGRLVFIFMLCVLEKHLNIDLQVYILLLKINPSNNPRTYKRFPLLHQCTGQERPSHREHEKLQKHCREKNTDEGKISWVLTIMHFFLATQN